jgi:signal transduction histidine kinase
MTARGEARAAYPLRLAMPAIRIHALLALAALLAPAAAVAGPAEEFSSACEALRVAAEARQHRALPGISHQLLMLHRQVPNEPAVAKALAAAAGQVRRGGGGIPLVLKLSKAAVNLARDGGYLQAHPDLFFWAVDSLTLLHRNEEALELCEERLRLIEAAGGRDADGDLWAQGIRDLEHIHHLQQLDLDEERLARERTQQQADSSRREVWSLAIIAILSTGLFGVMLHRARQQRRTQALLTEQNERLERLNAEKDEFLAIAAHDLKSPLGGIQRACEMIAYDKSMDLAFSRELALDMAGSAARMFHLITRVLDLHRIEHASAAPTLGPCNVSELCRSIVEEAQPAAREKDIDLALIAPEQSARVIGEPIRISQVVENLLSNALKFSPPGKRVVVELHEAEAAVEIIVADEGPGFAAEDRSKLFKKFARLSARPTNGEHSSGLGLAIVRAQVETLRGDIRVESEPGHGARFIVRLRTAHSAGALSPIPSFTPSSAA